MTEINYWLMKSEPSVYGINHLKDEQETLWDGIRNYQARNFMRTMEIGDQAFFYHSNCKPPAIVGLMEIIGTKIIDPTQFNPNEKYFDPKSLKKAPRWDCVKVKYLKIFTNPMSLNDMRELYSSEEMPVLRKGNRLSILPISQAIAKDLTRRLE